MRLSLVVIACLFAACAEAQPPNEAPSVEQGEPNTAFRPAFSQQTRAPLRASGITLGVARIAGGLDHPWAIAFLPDGRALVSERAGRLRVITRGGDISRPVAGLPRVDAGGQGGLLDVVLSPDFSRDRLLFWSYSEPRDGGGSGTSVARGRLSEDAARVGDVEVIFRQTPSWRSRGHYGARLDFDREGRLFVTLGERQHGESRVLAQDLGTHLGKVVRINPDGSVPADNPFLGRDGIRPEIWSYGHRNPQGADIDPATGDFWTIEHGPQGGDELNLTLAGRNYGWPIISYGEEYDGAPIGEGIAVRDGMEQPVYYWDPVIAPGDMDFYEGDLFPWRGDILVAGLRSQALVRLDLEAGRVVGEERFVLDVGRIRDLAEAADGSIWIVTDEGNGRVLRLTPRR